jgi:serine/threonine protein kinase
VLQLKGCFVDKNNRLVVVTEFLDGGTLEWALAIKRFKDEQVAFVARRVLQALTHLHSNKILHRGT